MTGRVLFHVQHLLGIGHLQRSLLIAEALTARGIDVTVVSGGPPVPELRRHGVALVELPEIRARDATFALVDRLGEPVADVLRIRRRDQLLETLSSVRPGAVVIEGFPFARRAFRFELDPLIAAARAASLPVICSVRDIPTVRTDAERLQAIVARIRHDFAAVLVHGDATFIPFGAAFPAASRIADRLRYTGYVAAPPAVQPGSDMPAGEVLVSAGGGAAGRALVTTAIEARRQGCLADRGWRILAGTNLSVGELAALRRDAPTGVAIEGFRRDFPALLARCHVSVSQAGYNTVLDILAARARSVLVPFSAERETEQLIRAEHLAAAGAAVLVREADLTPEALTGAITRAAAVEPVPISIDIDGARRAATLISRFLAK
jgi:predicted glycosyltransferase